MISDTYVVKIGISANMYVQLYTAEMITTSDGSEPKPGLGSAQARPLFEGSGSTFWEGPGSTF